MEGIVKELQCPICLEFYNYPVILPCAHILCRSPCAERLFDNGNFVKCPVCRDNSFVSGGVAHLPRVISLENIIETYRMPPPQPVPAITCSEPAICGKDDIPCQLCDRTPPYKAIKSCLDCNVSYCEKCLAISHPQREPFVHHQLVFPTRIERPTTKELFCPHHNIKVNIFCEDCLVLGCLLCADGNNAHCGHKIFSINQASDIYREKLQQNLLYLEEAQESLSTNILDTGEKLQSFQRLCEDRHSQINEQCDGLISEINNKRDFFLSDLEYEQMSKTESLELYLHELQTKQSNIQSLLMYNKDVLAETSAEMFLKLAKSVDERTNSTVGACKNICPSSPTSLHHKVVDLRKERVILKDIAYLQVPGTPAIDVSKCSRSVHSVILVLSSPEREYDVIDEYRVCYNTQNEELQSIRHVMIFKTPGEQRKYGRGPPVMNAVCLIHNDLQSDTMYSFGVKAYNETGESDMSPIIQCTTLQEHDTKLKVPEIVESMCRSYTYAIQIHSPSPCENLSEEGEISFYLLYREAAANKIWKSISLCGRVDHRVFGLDSDTMYDFVIMATGPTGECQVSNMVTLRTERSAY